MAQRGRPKKVEQIEVRGIISAPVELNAERKQQLYNLYVAFHKRLQITVSSDGKVFIYTFDDQMEQRLLALLPFMTEFMEQKQKVPQKDWRELKLEEALENALQ